MQTRPNGIVTITNDEVYDLSAHMARMADSCRVIPQITSDAARAALAVAMGTVPIGQCIVRTDIAGSPIEKWDGTVWRRTGTITQRWNRNAGSDANFTAANTNLVGGTIVGAPVGIWRLEAHLALYTGTSCLGRTFLSTGAAPVYDYRRNDLTSQVCTYYISNTITHAGGDLIMQAGFHVASGTATVLSAASGESSLIATFLGN